MLRNSFEHFLEEENNTDGDQARRRERISILIWIIDDNEQFARALSSVLGEFRIQVFSMVNRR